MPLPSDARSDKRYCSAKCRQRVSRTRRRGEVAGPNVGWYLDQERKESARLRTSLEKTRKALDKQRDRSVSLQTQIDRRDDYIKEQASKVAAARQRATQLLIERDAARQLANSESVNGDEVALLSKENRQLKEALKDLEQRYSTVTEALDVAVKEREFMRQVVRSWDGLCKRLYKSVNGSPRTEKDETTLDLWVRFRKHVGRPVKPISKGTL